MAAVIEIKQLGHVFNGSLIYDSLNLTLEAGRIYALLGKNGVGKTTLIKILMGFLRPVSGECRVFGEPSHALSEAARSRIGLLFEGHLAWDFFSITEIARFYAAFYPHWDAALYSRLVASLQLSPDHRIKNMSCGQRSQVVLALLLAQQPELLLLDDYSIGLDAGYRRLFLDVMREFHHQAETPRTIFLTSHMIEDMVDFAEEVIFLERGGRVLKTSPADFQQNFHCYRGAASLEVLPSPLIKNVEHHRGYTDIFSFASRQEIEEETGEKLTEHEMSLEDAFIGYTGRY